MRMAKRILSTYKDNAGVIHEIYYRHGYGGKDKFIHIMNKDGTLFKCKYNRNIVRFWGTKRNSIDLYIPRTDNDIEQILEMVLRPIGCEVKKVRIKTRARIMHELIKEKVVKRLTR